jgi:hypothetical protein
MEFPRPCFLLIFRYHVFGRKKIMANSAHKEAENRKFTYADYKYPGAQEG